MAEHPNAALIRRFYEGFAAKNAEQMNACYSSDVRFSDDVFGDLDAEGVRTMWSVLCGRAKDLVISHRVVEVSDEKGVADWEAHYTFAQTGRKVHNIIRAELSFKDGLISEHHDHFDFWRWSRQAFGPMGLLLGWSGWFKNKVRQKSRSILKPREPAHS